MSPILSAHEQSLIDQGLARVYRGRLIPVMRGGSDAEDADLEDTPLFAALPEDLTSIDGDELGALIESYATQIEEITSNPSGFVSDEFTTAELIEETRAAVDALQALRAELASRTVEIVPTDEELAAFGDLAELARGTTAVEPEPEPEPAAPEVEPETPVETAATEIEPVVAAAPPVRGRLPRPTARHAPVTAEREQVALVAGAGASDLRLGEEFLDPREVADAMIRRRNQFGIVPDGLNSKETIARASWGHLYPEDRRLGMDEVKNDALVASVTDPSTVKEMFQRRRRQAIENPSLVASGGICVPVTPYYDLAMVSQPTRPVRDSLASFNADRGGIRFARPATLSGIVTGIGSVTAANDALGGSFATKTCQTVECPPFSEVDVATIFHCLTFGNLGARTFPERVAQWNQLTLAAHARLAETLLLTAINAASTAVTASSLGLGASSDLLGQILAASNAMRSRHRMDPEAVLRLMLPDWALDLMISDVIRGQFQRFDTDEAKLTAFLRSFDLEPTFYIDGATGAAQVFGAQPAGPLLSFPSTVRWYLFPEGSFLYLDGGTLELGLVRDSVLNATNDFQIFGETFENVAFVGVESLAVTSGVCDSGAVSLPKLVTGCGAY